MSFTSPELVRAHLSGLRSGDITLTDTPVVLNGTQFAILPHSGLVENATVVKALRSQDPHKENHSLTTDWLALTYGRLVPGSVLMATDESLTTIYTENIDYLVDTEAGRIRRIAGGGIGDGAAVVVWYDHFHVYTSGDDYTLDPSQGRLARTSAGAIAEGQTVLVDYIVSSGVISDDVMEQAIAEVSDAVLSLIDARYHEQPLPGVVIGETHWTVASVCRIRAAALLVEAPANASGAQAAARTWLELADRYEQSGRERLARFAAPVATRTGARKN